MSEKEDQNKKAKIKKRLMIIVPAIIVLGVVIKLAFFRENFLYAGTIEVTKIDLPARVSSVIQKLNVREGDRLQRGQAMLTLSCEDYKLAQEIANRDYERADKLFRVGSQPKEIYDNMKNRKEDTDLKINWCNITSPITGVVLNKYHEEGEMVTPGTRLFTIASLKENVYAYIYVPQNLVAKLALGEKLTGYLPELDMKEFQGSITQVGDEAEFTPKNVQTREERTRLVYAIKVSFQNDQEILKPGMTIEVKIPEKK